MARGLPLPETSLCGDGTYSSCRAAPRWGSKSFSVREMKMAAVASPKIGRAHV